MPKMVQIRDVPEQVHAVLKARAAKAGMSVSDFIKQELERTGREDAFVAAHLLDVEVASAVRSLVAGRRTDGHRWKQLLMALAELPVQHYSHTPLLSRIWELRHNFTVYDAAYLALAEVMGAELWTCICEIDHRAQAAVVMVE